MGAVSVQEAFAMAVARHRAGRLDEAETLYRQVLAAQADHAEAWHHLGIIATQAGRPELAIAMIGRALELNPLDPVSHSNLGNAQIKLGDSEAAISSYRRALKLHPQFAEASNNLGNALREQGRCEEAVDAYSNALAIKPDYAEANYNLGNLFREQGRFEEAIAAYRRALELRPGDAKVLNNLGGVLAENDHLDEALAIFEQCLQLQPDSAETQNNLGNALKSQGRIEKALAAYRRACDLRADHAGMHSNLIYALQFRATEDRSVIEAEQKEWNLKFSRPVTPSMVTYANSRDPDRPLRVGYVSPEFWDHVTGRYLAPLLESHDHRNYQVLCYSGATRQDRRTEQFQRNADEWRNIVGVDDETAAKWIRQDRVDILVDLTQHLAGNRLPVFARRPAPIQISFAGYPESAGLEAIPYRITDRYLDVEAESRVEPEIAEQVFLVDSFWCYDPSDINLEVSDPPLFKNGHITFGCLNNFCKVNDQGLALWAEVLSSVEGSRLVLLSPSGSHRQKTESLFEKAGVERSRIRFVAPRPRRAYFELYHEIDIALDPFPCQGHTTTMDAMWMGVPMASLIGRCPIGRAGLSLLSNLDMNECAAFSPEDYVSIASSLAVNPMRLAEWRRTLRSRMQASLLRDAQGFARNIETVYRTCWRRWCRQMKSRPQ